MAMQIATDLTASRRQCHHEAGHVFARWYFGFITDYVEVYKKPPRRRGDDRVPVCLGRTVGPPILNTHFSEERFVTRRHEDRYRRDGEVRAEIMLIVIAAGVLAEVAISRCSEVATWVFGGGSNDFLLSEAVAERWLPGCRAPDTASLRARALLRAPRAQAAIIAVAERLRKQGRLENAEISEICMSVYDGQRPTYVSWCRSWPPSIDQLRSGAIC
jgi:hypothetical protein